MPKLIIGNKIVEPEDFLWWQYKHYTRLLNNEKREQGRKILSAHLKGVKSKLFGTTTINDWLC